MASKCRYTIVQLRGSQARKVSCMTQPTPVTTDRADSVCTTMQPTKQLMTGIQIQQQPQAMGGIQEGATLDSTEHDNAGQHPQAATSHTHTVQNRTPQHCTASRKVTPHPWTMKVPTSLSLTHHNTAQHISTILLVSHGLLHPS